MCDQTKEFPIPIDHGLTTLGDIIDLTPPDLISKVALEGKVFETWYSGRGVLMGDGELMRSEWRGWMMKCTITN